MSTIIITEETVTHLLKIYGPLLAIVVSLVVWAWHRIEKEIEDNQKVFITYVQKNDKAIADLYTLNRGLGNLLSKLIGTHNALTAYRIHDEPGSIGGADGALNIQNESEDDGS